MNMPKVLLNPRENILKEGKKVLIEKSYRSLNIRDIAKSCDIGIGTFYNYFKNKDELVIEIFMYDWNKIINSSKEMIDKNIDLKEKLRFIYTGMDEFLSNYMSVFYELTMVKGKDRKDHYHMDMIYEVVSEILCFHKSKGEIKNKLPVDKLCKLIVANMLSISREKFITFDELYESINI